mmetsp:Transcript_72707/g.193102  ORF Transcript_72707/g.193102 Transcript_72707/m.193102 type:complete len:307 (-) Transcript_72707:22-942(-)
MSPSGMSTSTRAPYSAFRSTTRHFREMAREAFGLFPLEMLRALAAKRASRTVSQAAALAKASTSRRLNLTMTTGLPLLMAWPRLLTLLFTPASKSAGRAPLTRTNSSSIMPSQVASSSPASLQSAHISAAAFTSPSFFMAPYSWGFMPPRIASALAAARHCSGSTSSVQLGPPLEFRSSLEKWRFTMPSASSPDSPAASFRPSSSLLHASRPCVWMQVEKTSPRISRAAFASISLFRAVNWAAGLPGLMKLSSSLDRRVLACEKHVAICWGVLPPSVRQVRTSSLAFFSASSCWSLSKATLPLPPL